MTLIADEVVEAIPLPALLIRADERIAAINAAGEGLLGKSLSGRHFITALRQPALLDAIEAVLQGGSARQAQYLAGDAVRATTYAVSIRPLSLMAHPAVLVTFTDVSAVEEAGQIRRDFVANVSHELRTPLTALIGFIETLKGPAANDAAARERFLGIMATEAARMTRLVDDLLSLSRVEAEERVRPTTRIDLAALVNSVRHGLEDVARKASVSMESLTPEAPVMITGDGDQLRQVLTNLTENAIKYSGAGARVCVTLNTPAYEPGLRAEGVRVSVQDTGPGIDPHHIPRLTERFYRVDMHRSREAGGTGLGLAIVKHIIGRHRGRLRIESTPGEGSNFVVILPVDQAGTESA
ncbi:cell wall metabolism sensor histidine kinase WalK [Cognatishimia sp. F0-27]|uniref:sensor histidine kinase n=1 Tax=Cognatishimia sp. F0-27 TaxID=2816855 RepID=UPI001D0C5E9D|nr:ATP-binding protein [Cognatishimia sp. F0-27]MCC1492665.1 two-component sensor histidine kinase [Cognatishimia sp. F0-27]